MVIRHLTQNLLGILKPTSKTKVPFNQLPILTLHNIGQDIFLSLFMLVYVNHFAVGRADQKLTLVDENHLNTLIGKSENHSVF